MNRNDSVFESTSYYHQRFPVNCQLVFERCPILHEYIDGHTLFHCLKHYPGFLTDWKHPLTKSLDRFVTQMLVHAVFFKDLHTRNLIYDGYQWQIIDSQNPKAFDAPRRAWDKLYTSLYLGEHWGFGKWRMPFKPRQWRDLKHYMDHVEHDLLPAVEAAYAGPSRAVHALIHEFRTHVRQKKRRPSSLSSPHRRPANIAPTITCRPSPQESFPTAESGSDALGTPRHGRHGGHTGQMMAPVPLGRLEPSAPYKSNNCTVSCLY